MEFSLILLIFPSSIRCLRTTFLYILRPHPFLCKCFYYGKSYTLSCCLLEFRNRLLFLLLFLCLAFNFLFVTFTSLSPSKLLVLQREKKHKPKVSPSVQICTAIRSQDFSLVYMKIPSLELKGFLLLRSFQVLFKHSFQGKSCWRKSFQ